MNTVTNQRHFSSFYLKTDKTHHSPFKLAEMQGSNKVPHSVPLAGEGCYQEERAEAVTMQCTSAVYLGQMALYNRSLSNTPHLEPVSSGAPDKDKTELASALIWDSGVIAIYLLSHWPHGAPYICLLRSLCCMNTAGLTSQVRGHCSAARPRYDNERPLGVSPKASADQKAWTNLAPKYTISV